MSSYISSLHILLLHSGAWSCRHKSPICMLTNTQLTHATRTIPGLSIAHMRLRRPPSPNHSRGPPPNRWLMKSQYFQHKVVKNALLKSTRPQSAFRNLFPPSSNKESFPWRQWTFCVVFYACVKRSWENSGLAIYFIFVLAYEW